MLKKSDQYELALSAAGNVLTWYCFGLFMPFLHVLSRSFFSNGNGDTAEVAVISFLVVSAGLFLRPVGALIFGPIGDKLGRQKALSMSILMMVVPTFCIGLMPNYQQIGILSPIALLLFRSLQGVSMGGEFTAAMVHLVELAPRDRRGFFGSLSEAGGQVGVLLANASLVLLYVFFSEAEIYEYAWRYPFFASVLLMPFVFIHPHKEKVPTKKNKNSIFVGLLTYQKEILSVGGVTAFSSVAFYTSLTFLPYYLVKENTLTLMQATKCGASFNLAVIFSSMFFGYLSDFLKRKLFLNGGIIGVTLVTCFMFLAEAKSPTSWIFIHIMYGFFMGMYFASRAAFFAEAFPKSVRCTGIGISMSLAQAVVGGLTPVIMHYCTSISPLFSIIPITFTAWIGAFSLRGIEDRTGMELK